MAHTWPQVRKFIASLILLFATAHPASSESAIDHFQRGNKYREAGEAAKSIVEYEEAIRLNPYYKEAYHSLGLVYISSGLTSKATSALKKAIEIDPNYTQAMVLLGEAYDRGGNSSQAIDVYGRALELEPNNKGARLGLAAVYRKGALWDRAVAEYERVRAIDPREDRALVGLGDVRLGQGLTDEAIDYYTQALTMNPDRLETYLKRGEAYEKGGFKERSLENYRSAVRLSPDDVRAYRSLGSFYIRAGDVDRAIEAYRVLSRLSPLDGSSHYALGVAYERRGKLKEAISTYSEALRLLPDDEVARYRLEEALIKNDAGGNPSPRRREMALYHLVQGDRYYDGRQARKALHEYERALRLGRQEPAARLGLSSIYEYLGYRERAISELSILLELEPSNTDARDLLERLIRGRNQSTAIENVDLERIPDSGTKIAILDLRRAEDSPEAHIDLGGVVSEILKSLLASSRKVRVLTSDEISGGMRSLGLPEVADETQARRVAERVGAEAFLFGEAYEGPEELTLSVRLIWVNPTYDLYRASLTRRGNGRVIDAATSAVEAVLKNVPFRGVVIGLDRDRAVINLGRMEEISEGMELGIYRQRLLKSDPGDGGDALSEEEVGRLKVTGVDERVAVGRITTKEAIGRVNVGDVVRVLAGEPREAKK